MGELHLSARAHDHILKAARTIANLAGSEGIRLSNTARWTEFVALSEKFHKEVNQFGFPKVRSMVKLGAPLPNHASPVAHGYDHPAGICRVVRRLAASVAEEFRRQTDPAGSNWFCVLVRQRFQG